MKQLDVFTKIGGILKELNEQYDYLKADTHNLNELELELFVANAHFLKDHAEILRRLNERKNTPPAQAEKKPEPAPQPKPEITPIAKFEPVHEQRFFEPVVQQQHIPAPQAKLELTKEEVEEPVHAPYNPVKTELTSPVAEDETPTPQIDLEPDNDGDLFSFERQEPEVPKQELVVDDYRAEEEPANEIPAEHEVPTSEILVEEELQPEEPVLTEPEPEPVVEEEPFIAPAVEPEVTPPAANAITPEPEVKKESSVDRILSFNQRMMAQRAEKAAGVTAGAAELPVTDLKSAINLNDKLLYIKELFNGYSLAYSEAIEIVNRFNTFEEAERFLKTNYVVKNNWAAKQPTVDKFFALLKRRYPQK